jgi:predicted kinase
MSRELLILRGLPGGGKSTVAKSILEGSSSVIVCSADDYFMVDGRYEFDPARLGKAHQACIMSADRSMANGYALVVIDNTNIKKEHYLPYIKMAEKYGYTVTVRTIGSVDPSVVSTYHKRQVHGVPEETIRRMAETWEEHD